jgi:hypothetical protein
LSQFNWDVTRASSHLFSWALETQISFTKLKSAISTKVVHLFREHLSPIPEY